MKRLLPTSLLVLSLLTPLCGAPAPDSSLLLWLPLDEGAGTLATDRSPHQLEAELTNVQWAKGAFGTAARFGGTNAFIDLPPVPSLNGATQCTVSVRAAKRFHDLHLASAAKYRDSDLLEPQMGWWAPRQPTPQARGHFLDEMEYFGAKNLGLDSAMSVQGVNVSRQPLGCHLEKQFTVLGWYEQLRLARYFDPQTVARVAVPGDEVRDIGGDVTARGGGVFFTGAEARAAMNLGG